MPTFIISQTQDEDDLSSSELAPMYKYASGPKYTYAPGYSRSISQYENRSPNKNPANSGGSALITVREHTRKKRKGSKKTPAAKETAPKNGIFSALKCVLLTPNACSSLLSYSGDDIVHRSNVICQILGVKKVQSLKDTGYNYQIVISDGQQFLEVTLRTLLNEKVESKKLPVHSIVRISEHVVENEKTIKSVIVSKLTVLETNVKIKIGNPVCFHGVDKKGSPPINFNANSSSNAVSSSSKKTFMDVASMKEINQIFSEEMSLYKEKRVVTEEHKNLLAEWNKTWKKASNQQRKNKKPNFVSKPSAAQKRYEFERVQKKRARFQRIYLKASSSELRKLNLQLFGDPDLHGDPELRDYTYYGINNVTEYGQKYVMNLK